MAAVLTVASFQLLIGCLDRGFARLAATSTSPGGTYTARAYDVEPGDSNTALTTVECVVSRDAWWGRLGPSRVVLIGPNRKAVSLAWLDEARL